ncbi:PREDICTED: uncharacterized protein LOC108561862 isoform X2 [Nicrophorus vespilloides]|uniref:Uncharacterized protein LOC108561862 isoform X2 n=1 Tax=Nicrophorus vespilloides TaxID=110193 RepID=A0ABM1MLK4_NICVS|nr:PREDICTED: uncharacterized protein LOC108561862 isoform X2 [Nicrophorus vespilloides]
MGDEGSYGPEGLVLQQQWVTLTASMWPKPTASPRGWRIPTDRLPLLAAVFCGAALVVCLIFAFVVYRCCIMPRKEKHYCMRKADGSNIPNAHISSTNGLPSYPSQSAVYAEPKGHNWGYTNRLVATSSSAQWFPNQQIVTSPQCTHCPGICPVPRSSSVPGSSPQVSVIRKQRPVSQPITGLVLDNGTLSKQIPMPEISEFSAQSTQYASSSILDEVSGKDSEISPSTTLKTRSLPAWVRSKPRPLSTEDDLNDLYAKVNFSKKRKNRMRNDEAAIIALSKSRSQFLHKDTDSLVDNEAVIVYDERTAL